MVQKESEYFNLASPFLLAGVWTLESKKQNQENQQLRNGTSGESPEQQNQKKRKRRNVWEEKRVTPPTEINLALTAPKTDTNTLDSSGVSNTTSPTNVPADIPWTEAKPSLTHMALQGPLRFDL